MMDCNVCKKTIPEDSEFCPFCGSKIVHKTEEFSESGESLHQYQTEALLKRAFLFLEDGLFEKADVYVEEVLNRAPENAEAYIVKLMIELRVKTREELGNFIEPFDTSKNYQKALRFADDKLKGYIEHIHVQSENTRLENIYLEATNAMSNAVNEETYKQAAAIFRRIPGYKDSAACLSTCLERAENMRKDAIYSYAILKRRGATQLYELKRAMEEFQSISEWKDSEEQILLCQQKIEEMKQQEERQARTEKKVAIVSLFVLSIVIVFCFLLFCVIIPNNKYNNALALMNDGEYETAIFNFKALNGYKDSDDKIKECRYNQATALMAEGKYEEAILSLRKIYGYRDGFDKIIECNTAIFDKKYNDSIKLIEGQKYNEAILILKTLEGYKDSKEKIEECNVAILDGKYENAITLMNAEKYIEAIPIFEELYDYKDSAEKLTICKLRAVKAGDYLIFGMYEQDNDLTNGKEDIEWMVLAREENKILVISKYALDFKLYNTNSTKVTWETCSLRKWLNNDFINIAFADNEKAMISMITVSADKNPNYDTTPGQATQDQVFLLSITEANKYFSSDSARQCKPTDYVVGTGAYVNRDNGNCWWWLRTPGNQRNAAAGVSSDGGIVEHGGLTYYSDAVRPAMWIDLEAYFFEREDKTMK